MASPKTPNTLLWNGPQKIRTSAGLWAKLFHVSESLKTGAVFVVIYWNKKRDHIFFSHISSHGIQTFLFFGMKQARAQTKHAAKLYCWNKVNVWFQHGIRILSFWCQYELCMFDQHFDRLQVLLFNAGGFWWPLFDILIFLRGY